MYARVQNIEKPETCNIIYFWDTICIFFFIVTFKFFFYELFAFLLKVVPVSGIVHRLQSLASGLTFFVILIGVFFIRVGFVFYSDSDSFLRWF